MCVSSSTSGNGTRPRNALRAIHSSAVESLPIDHSMHGLLIARYASRKVVMVSASSRSRESTVRSFAFGLNVPAAVEGRPDEGEGNGHEREGSGESERS